MTRQDWAHTHWVEIDLDYADQLAARAEYTLILIGPARVRMIGNNAQWAKYLVENANLSTLIASAGKDLKPLGLAQGINFSVSRQRVPIMEIGSELMALVSSQTSMAQVSIQRLIADVDSFLKKVKRNLVPPQLRDTLAESKVDFALHGKGDKWPFGMAMLLYADLSEKPIAKLYVEHCKVVGIGTTIGAGQAVMYEGVQILAHRILEFDVAGVLPDGT